MKAFLSMAVLFASFSTFANTFTSLDCAVQHSYPTPAEQAFKLKVKFQSPINSINDSGLDKSHKADLVVTFGSPAKTKTIKDVGFRQSTSAYGYEIAFQKRLAGSEYNSFLSLSPKFKGFVGKTLSHYTGLTEMNMMIDGYDAMVIKTEYLVCVPSK